jgi:sulfur-oxidizing protein SoxX
MAASVAAAADLVAYRIDGDAIAAPLAGYQGDVERGRALVAARDPANCVLCHAIPGIPPPAGDVGPSLAGVGSRLTLAQLRLRVVDDRRVNAASVMPGYYRVDGLNAVAPAVRGKPMLAASDVEDIVAFVGTLK